jgi:hypothetical protein
MPAENERRDTTLINEIVTRLAVVESYIRAREIAESEDRRWLRGMALAFGVQFLGLVGAVIVGAVYMGGMMNRLDTIDVATLHNQSANILRLLAEQSNEIGDNRDESFRLRGSIDAVRKEVHTRTEDRFYKTEGIAIEKRVKRLEDHLFDLKREAQ